MGLTSHSAAPISAMIDKEGRSAFWMKGSVMCDYQPYLHSELFSSHIGFLCVPCKAADRVSAPSLSHSLSQRFLTRRQSKVLTGILADI